MLETTCNLIYPAIFIAFNGETIISTIDESGPYDCHSQRIWTVQIDSGVKIMIELSNWQWKIAGYYEEAQLVHNAAGYYSKQNTKTTQLGFHSI